MKFSLFFAIAAASVVGCSGSTDAENAVKRILNDPESAQFTQVVPGKNSGDFCGVVNAKNRLGGYVGGRPFYFDKRSAEVGVVKVAEESDFRALWQSIRAREDFANELQDLRDKCDAPRRYNSVCEKPIQQKNHPMCEIIQSSALNIYETLKLAFE